MVLEDNPFGASILNDLVRRKLLLEDFTAEAEGRGVYVVQLDEITTCEVRDDNSRYFPEVENGIVIGGNFG